MLQRIDKSWCEKDEQQDCAKGKELPAGNKGLPSPGQHPIIVPQVAKNILMPRWKKSTRASNHELVKRRSAGWKMQRVLRKPAKYNQQPRGGTEGRERDFGYVYYHITICFFPYTVC